ncbi:hypothetical protein [Sutterella sp.]|uniref:hypothetical protein n=1 Tax=Sutterella sp. TaxID=1981025 RepID=UPI003FD79C4B
MPFLILPVLAYVLLCAHLMFHGFGLAAFAPLAAALLLAVPRRPVVWLQTALLMLAAAEWLRAGWLLVERRLAWGEPWHLAAAIMAGCALFTVLCALVFRAERLRRFYR